MGQKPCVCEGSNENCCHCFGSGFVQTRRDAPTPSVAVRKTRVDLARLRELNLTANPLATPARSRISSQRSTPPKSQKRLDETHSEYTPAIPNDPTICLIPPVTVRKLSDIEALLTHQVTIMSGAHGGKRRAVCRYCLRWIGLDGSVKEHLLRCRSIPERVDLKQLDGRPVSPQVRLQFKCESCGLKFPKEHHLTIHVRRACLGEKTSSSSSFKPLGMRMPEWLRRQIKAEADQQEKNEKAKRLAPRAGDLLKCPKCSSMVKGERLSSHLRRVHGISGTRPPTDLGKDGQRRKPKVLPAEYTQRQVFDEIVGIDRRDRTKGIGYVVREAGRYGSHSSHDGFDDDSGPE